MSSQQESDDFLQLTKGLVDIGLTPLQAVAEIKDFFLKKLEITSKGRQEYLCSLNALIFSVSNNR
jgi:hypothetical protein